MRLRIWAGMTEPESQPGWIADRRGWQRVALAALAGAAAGLGQVPFSLFWLALPAFALGYLLWRVSVSGRAAFGAGWAFGLGYFAVTLHWIVEPFLVDVARHGWMAPFALVLLSGGLALFWGAAFALTHAMRSGPAGIVGWAGALSLAELLRGNILTGFPWALPGYIWSETSVFQVLSLVGPYGLTLMTLLVAAGLARVALPQGRLSGAMLVAVLAALMMAPAMLGTAPLGPEGPVIRLVQPNAPQEEKWDPDKVNMFFRRQLEFTAEPAEVMPALVVWPETAIPWALERAGDTLSYVADAAAGVPVVLGANRREDGRSYNALAVVEAEGRVTGLYDKHHLVPFGEYIPFGGLAELVGLRSFAARDGYGFSPGPGPRLLDFGALGSAVPLICYEAIFPGSLRGTSRRPDWILQITNDAWFGKIAGPQQHLAQARARAIEQGLPMVRVANTGISAMIDAQGHVVASLPLGEAGYLDVALPPRLEHTVYSRVADNPAWVASLLCLLAGYAGRRKFSG